MELEQLVVKIKADVSDLQKSLQTTKTNLKTFSNTETTIKPSLDLTGFESSLSNAAVKTSQAMKVINNTTNTALTVKHLGSMSAATTGLGVVTTKVNNDSRESYNNMKKTVVAVTNDVSSGLSSVLTATETLTTTVGKDNLSLQSSYSDTATTIIASLQRLLQAHRELQIGQSQAISQMIALIDAYQEEIWLWELSQATLQGDMDSMAETYQANEAAMASMASGTEALEAENLKIASGYEALQAEYNKEEEILTGIRGKLSDAVTEYNNLSDKMAKTSSEINREETNLKALLEALQAVTKSVKEQADAYDENTKAKKTNASVTTPTTKTYSGTSTTPTTTTTTTDTSNTSSTGLLALIKSLGGGKFLSAAGAVLIGKKASSAFSSELQIENRSNVAFGNAAEEMNNWAETVTSALNMTKSAVLDNTSTFKTMATASGVADDAANTMAKNLTARMADLISFYDVEEDQAQTAMNAIFTGNTESLRTAFGINMTQANLQDYMTQQGSTQKYTDLSEVEKTMVRYQYVMEKTSNAQNDAANTINDFANQINKLMNEIQVVLEPLGLMLSEIIVPVLQILAPLLELLTTIIERINKWLSPVVSLLRILAAVLDPIISIIETLFDKVAGIFELDDFNTWLEGVADDFEGYAGTGISEEALEAAQITAVNTSILANNDSSDVIEENTEAIEAATKTLMNFDELNVINSQASSSASKESTEGQTLTEKITSALKKLDADTAKYELGTEGIRQEKITQRQNSLLQSKVDAATETIDDLTKELAYLEDIQYQIEVTGDISLLDEVNAGDLNELDTRIKNIRNMLDDVKSRMGTITNDSGTVTADTTTVNNVLKYVGSKIGIIQTEVGNTAEKLHTMGVNISGLKPYSDKVHTSLSSWHTDIDTANESLLNLYKSIDKSGVSKALDRLKSSLEELKASWDLDSIKEGLSYESAQQEHFALKNGTSLKSTASTSLWDLLANFFSKWGITGFAAGGFPELGTLALMGEVAGQTEILGNINGRTGVVGGNEITGIASAVYATGKSETSLLREQNSLLRQLLNKDVTLAPNAAAGKWVATAQKAYSRVAGV